MLELIIVVVVLGVLTAVAIPTFRAVQNNSKVKADELSLASVAKEAGALVAFEQDVVTRENVVEALEDCTSCTLAADVGVSAQAAERWVVVGYDYDGPSGPAEAATDPAMENDDTTRAWSYGHIVGDGWGTPAVHLVMASRVDGRFVHAMLSGYSDVATWADGNPRPDDLGELVAAAEAGDTAITLTWEGLESATSYTARCWTADGTASDPAGTATATGDGTDEVTVTVEDLENFVEHTCQVTANTTAKSNEVTATPTTGTEAVADGPHPDEMWPLDGELVTVNPTPTGSDDPEAMTALEETIAASSDALTGLAAFPTGGAYPRTFYVTAGPSGALIAVTETAAGVAAPPRIFLPADTFEFPAGIIAGPSPDHSVEGYTTLYVTDAAAGEVWRIDPTSGARHRIKAGLDRPTDLEGFTCHDAVGATTTGVCLVVTTDAGLLQLDVSSGATRAIDAAMTAASAVRAVTGSELWVTNLAPSIQRRSTTTGAALSPDVSTVGYQAPADIDPTGTGSVLVTDHGSAASPGGIWSHPVNDPTVAPTKLTTPGVTRPAGLLVNRADQAAYVIDNDDHCLHRTSTTGGAVATLWCSTGSVEKLDLAYSGTPGGTGGLFWHLGTNGGTVSFENPAGATTGFVDEQATSGAPHTLTDRNTASSWFNNDVGYSTTVSWDLGPTRQMKLNRWEIRTSGTASRRPTGVRWEGSNDGTTWAPLYVATGEPQWPTSTWVTAAVTSSGAYRHLRVQIPNTACGCGAVDLNEVELYGTLQITPPPVAANLAFSRLGGTGGLVWDAGTQGGTAAFQNPSAATTGWLDERASDTEAGHLPQNATDRNAGTRWSANCVAGASIQWDLGPDRRLDVDRYELASNAGDPPLLRNWVLEGSLDESAWTTIRSHVNDTSLSYNGDRAGWWVTDSQPWRYLRIRHTGPSAPSLHQNCTSIFEIEFYGNLTVTPPSRTYDFANLGGTGGLFWSAGTATGTQPYANPVPGVFPVFASSTEGSNVAARATDRNGTTRWSSNCQTGARIRWDMGASRRLDVDRYELASYSGDTPLLRNWVFEGSLDGTSWTTIRSHVNDSSISYRGDRAGWWVASTTPWRYLQIRHVGPSTSIASCTSIFEVEFYGTVTG